MKNLGVSKSKYIEIKVSSVNINLFMSIKRWFLVRFKMLLILTQLTIV